MKELIAIGKDIHGEIHEFSCLGGQLICFSKRLIELSVPEGVEYIWCYDNQLIELKLSEGVKQVFCEDNQLTELIITEGVETVSCYDNQITHLDLPDSVTRLWCDKEVTGLERYVGKVRMDLL